MEGWKEMKRIVSILLSLFLLIGCTAFADYIPSPTVEDLYVINGCAAFVQEVTEEDEAFIDSFPESIVDYFKLNVFPNENGDGYFSLVIPEFNLENYAWFLVDGEGHLVGNLNYEFCQCTCGEWWYNVDVHLAPAWIDGGQFYLIFVKR